MKANAVAARRRLRDEVSFFIVLGFLSSVLIGVDLLGCCCVSDDRQIGRATAKSVEDCGGHHESE